jgi:hypothetical protein
MLRHEYPEFRTELDRLAGLYGREKPDDALCQLYWNALRDVSLDALKACALLHTKRSKFFPKPAELRPKGTVFAEPREPDTTLPAAEALVARRWDERLQVGGPEVRWQLLCAYLARTDQEDPSGLVFAERMEFCAGAARRLLAQHGPKWCVYDPHAMHAASRLLGGDAVMRGFAESPQGGASPNPSQG